MPGSTSSERSTPPIGKRTAMSTWLSSVMVGSRSRPMPRARRSERVVLYGSIRSMAARASSKDRHAASVSVFDFGSNSAQPATSAARATKAIVRKKSGEHARTGVQDRFQLGGLPRTPYCEESTGRGWRRLRAGPGRRTGGSRALRMPRPPAACGAGAGRPRPRRSASAAPRGACRPRASGRARGAAGSSAGRRSASLRAPSPASPCRSSGSGTSRRPACPRRRCTRPAASRHTSSAPGTRRTDAARRGGRRSRSGSSPRSSRVRATGAAWSGDRGRVGWVFPRRSCANEYRARLLAPRCVVSSARATRTGVIGNGVAERGMRAAARGVSGGTSTRRTRLGHSASSGPTVRSSTRAGPAGREDDPPRAHASSASAGCTGTARSRSYNPPASSWAPARPPARFMLVLLLLRLPLASRARPRSMRAPHG